MIFILRQFKSVVGPFIVVIISMFTVLGFMAINGFPITAVFGMLPPILMAVGIADAVHIITEYQVYLRAGHDNRTSILKAVNLLGFPYLITSITTAVGFCSLATSPQSPVQELVQVSRSAAGFNPFTFLPL